MSRENRLYSTTRVNIEMIILEGIEIDNYRNLKHTSLDHLRDLNILIGPNNCGKSNLLELIASLAHLDPSGKYTCPNCEVLRRFKEDQIGKITLFLNSEDFYLRKSPSQVNLRFSFSLNRASIDRMVPKILAAQDSLILEMRQRQQQQKIETVIDGVTKKIEDLSCVNDTITLKNEGITLYGEHISPFVHKYIIDEIKKTILYCPEGRLQSYRNKNFDEYIRDKRFSGADSQKLIKFIGDLVDPAIQDHKYWTLIKKVVGQNFEVSIAAQGSGVRSLICLVADILSSPQAKILLIDEPELGLNPFVKQQFLRFLLGESAERQIFIATQDPTFVNPSLWAGRQVSVYFYSLIEGKFVKIDLSQNREDPDTFAGYLPHTTSLRNIHIYVEGTSDVYIYQIFLQKYMSKTFENWFEVVNKVGVYHLGGDFWQHLLYTVPKSPYRCIVILDGHKRLRANEVCQKHNSSVVVASTFRLCDTIADVAATFGGETHPIYCLKKQCIEEYLGLDPANLPKDYNKKRDGPKLARSLRTIPKEIQGIFEVIFRGLEQKQCIKPTGKTSD